MGLSHSRAVYPGNYARVWLHQIRHIRIVSTSFIASKNPPCWFFLKSHLISFNIKNKSNLLIIQRIVEIVLNLNIVCTSVTSMLILLHHPGKMTKQRKSVASLYMARISKVVIFISFALVHSFRASLYNLLLFRVLFFYIRIFPTHFVLLCFSFNVWVF